MKQVINTHAAPAAIGPYNQANEAGGMLFISGQIALHPTTGVLVMDDIATETRQVLNNLQAIVENAGLTLENIVKCSVFVKDMADYAVINGVYAEYFAAETAPARELVQVAALPRYVNVEISAIAVR
jgi:2-iminobutanoate/2-iminopropanoate deaminase